MNKKIVLELSLSLLMVLMASSFPSVTRGEILQRWQATDGGGIYSENNGTLTFSGNAQSPGPTLYREISPQSDFEFSLQIKAATLGEVSYDPNGAGEGFSLMLRPNITFGAPTGINFELRARGGGMFLLARHNNLSWWDWTPFVYNTFAYDNGSSYWHSDLSKNAVVKPDVWYTMTLKVQKSPFVVTATVTDENGVTLGSFSASDMVDFTFKDIKFLGISSGFGGTFYIRNFTTRDFNVHDETLFGWQVQNRGGYVSESNGIIKLGSDAPDKGVILYKEISPKTDFEFSLQIKGSNLGGFDVFVGNTRYFDELFQCVNFELENKYGTPNFLMARYVHTIVWETGKPGDIWDWQGFGVGQENVWYTMNLKVQAKPFKVTGEVFNENGVFLGSYSVSDMINLKFEDIAYVGFSNVWGGDIYVRNISDVSNIAKNTVQTQISISPEISSSTLGSPISIRGKLTDSKGNALTNKIVVVSYTFAGLDEWLPISSSYTNEAGEYGIQWINTASGNFTLKAEWKGDSVYQGASNTTTLNILPYQNQTVFFVESNSTTTSLAFNVTTSQLSFTVSGPSGTSGYVKATVAKSLLPNGANAKIYLDGNQLNYELQEMPDSWLFTFNYHHSTHLVTLDLSANQNSASSFDIENSVWILAVIAVSFIVLVLGIFLQREKKPFNS